MSRYEIGLCQKFNPLIHGFNPDTSSPDIEDHYICLFTFDFSCVGSYKTVMALAKHYCATIEIVETTMLYPGTETIAIYKTFWLRIFQRMCRKWIIQRRFSRSSRIYTFLLKREYQKTNITI
jgi:hypothetical protein